MARIRVLVVDDHRIFAEALATALAAEPDIEVCAAGSAPAAERALDRAAGDGRPFHVVLVDADLGTADPRPGGTAPRPPGPSAARPAGADGSPRPGGPGPARLPAGQRPHPPAEGPGRPAAQDPHPAVPAQPGRAVPSPVMAAPLPPGPASTPGAAAAAVDGWGARPGAAVPPGPALPAASDAAAAGPQGCARPDADGIALVARVRADRPGLRAVVLASDDDPRRAVRALQAGAAGWVAKESSLVRLTAVLRGVLRDETHLPPALLTGVIRELTAARRDRTEGERLVDTLTPREKQVLRCMVAGMGRQAVADRLYLSPHTVRTHMQNVLGKLGVHSTLAAVALARRAGVGPAGPA